MTFTEAAVEVLRRAGKPLHYREIAEAAVRENLLSHVGQDPEVTMGQRLAAMAKREEDRKVVAVAPEGSFALTEWNVPAEAVIEAKTPSAIPEGAEEEKPYRGREREPRPINAQARRRMEALAPSRAAATGGASAAFRPLPRYCSRRWRSGRAGRRSPSSASSCSPKACSRKPWCATSRRSPPRCSRTTGVAPRRAASRPSSSTASG
jgi:hypothetical protein